MMGPVWTSARQTAALLVLLCGLGLPGFLAQYLDEENRPIFTRDFAVELSDDGDDIIADLVAQAYGFKVVKRLANLGNVYYFEHKDVPHRSKRSAEDILDALRKDPNVKRAEQQKLLTRKKRELLPSNRDLDLLRGGTDDHPDVDVKKRLLEILKRYQENHQEKRTKKTDSEVQEKERAQDDTVKYNDPEFPNQWYLQEDRRSRRSVSNLDLNLGVVWEQGITGNGVVVTVMDDGIQYTHPDLKKNYDPKASTDLNDPEDKDGDPMPNTKVWGNE